MQITIDINGLRLYGRHGVSDQERSVGNMFEVNASLLYPADEAVLTDRLESTLNYAEAIETIKHEMEVPSRLLEHVAGRMRKALIERFPLISGGMIQLNKLNPPCGVEIGSTGVTIKW